MRDKNAAVILAAGKGSRMGGAVPKQFMPVDGEPMVVKSLRTFAACDCIDQIVLVTDAEHAGYCRELIEEKGIAKVEAVVEGGAERYDSVRNGLEACRDCRFVFIHDSARPYVTGNIIERAYEAVREHPACVVGVPSKDTVKIADPDGYVAETPARSRVWLIQTPQVFDYELLCRAYGCLEAGSGFAGITDDASIVEKSGLCRVRLVEGAYGNIKITTPEDLGQE